MAASRTLCDTGDNCAEIKAVHSEVNQELLHKRPDSGEADKSSNIYHNFTDLL